MSWNVIAFGNIEVDNKYKKEVIKQLEEINKKDTDIMRIDFETLEFEMSGNKRIDYDPLDELGEWAKKNNISLEISTSEYSECGNGYYFNSNNEVE